MSTTVIINDFVASRRSTIVLDESDFDFVRRQWGKPDKILADLQSHPLYKGRMSWRDLDPHHLHCMIVLTVERVAGLDQLHRQNPDYPAVKSLNFLICALVHCIQSRCESIIDLIKFTRISANELVYDYSAAMNTEVDLTQPDFGLKMIIDNT